MYLETGQKHIPFNIPHKNLTHTVRSGLIGGKVN